MNYNILHVYLQEILSSVYDGRTQIEFKDCDIIRLSDEY